MGKRRKSDPMKGIVAGAVGGLVASFVMNFVHQAWGAGSGLIEKELGKGEGRKERESEPENPSGDADPATVKMAMKVSKDLLDYELTEKEKKIAGPLVHYGFGTTMGAIYGGISELQPASSLGAGIPFGAILWLLADEVVVPAMGVSKKPTEYPPSTHAEALTAHLVYGLTTETVRKVLRQVF